MKKITLALSVVLFSLVASAQSGPTGFPSTDSLHRYNNRFIRNSAVEAFSNLRLNTLLHGIIQWIDTAVYNEVLDTATVETITLTSDSSIIITQLGGDTVKIEVDPDIYTSIARLEDSLDNVRMTYENGLTKTGTTVQWNGPLVDPVDIDQDANGITFHDGLFSHYWGDYSQVSAFSVLENGQLGGYWAFGDGGSNRALFQQTVSSPYPVGEWTVTSTDYPLGSVVRLLAHKLTLGNYYGEVYIDGLIDSTQSYQLQYNPTNKKVTYGIGGGGGGLSSITGSRGIHISGGTDVRWGNSDLDSAVVINQDGNGITFHDGLFTHGTGNYAATSGTYSVLRNSATEFQASQSDGTLYAKIISEIIPGDDDAYVGLTTQNGDADITVSSKYGVFLGHVDGLVFLNGIIDSAQEYTLQYNPTNKKVTYALAASGSGVGSGGSGDSIYAANGLTMRNDSTVVFGGTFDQNTTLNSAGYSLALTGSASSGSFNVTNTHATASAITATGGTSAAGLRGIGGQYGVYGSTTAGVGVRGLATTGTGVSAIGDILPFQAQRTSSLTNTLGQIGEFSLITSGTPANGLGGYFGFYLESNGGGGAAWESGRLITKWTDATHATRTSQIDIWNTNLGLERRVQAITGAGQQIWDQYGVGDFTGTPVYYLGADASGNIIEVDPGDLPGGGGSTTVSHDATLTGTGASGSPLGVNTGSIATIAYVDSRVVNANSSMPTGWTSALSISGVVANGSYTGGTNIATLINNWIATAPSGATLFFPRSGTGYKFSAPIVYPSTKRLHIVVEGTLYFGTSDGIIMDGYLQTLDAKKGNIYGTNQTASAPNYTGQTNTGVWVRSCESCRADMGEVMGFKYGNQVGGYATGTALVQGAQFNQITFTYLRRNSVGIYVHPSGGTTNSRGNWSNANSWGGPGGKIVADTGILFRPDITQGDRFNGNNFYSIHLENGGTTSIPMKVGIYMDYAVNNSFFGTRFEPNPITRKLVCDTDVDNTNFYGTAYFQWDWLDAPGNNINIDGAIYDGVSGLAVGYAAKGYRYSSSSTFFNQRVKVLGTTRSPSATLNIPSNIDVEYTNETSTLVTAGSYSVLPGIEMVRVNYSSGTSTITLPAAASHPSRTIIVKNLHATNVVAVTGQSNIAASGVGVYRSEGGIWNKIN